PVRPRDTRQPAYASNHPPNGTTAASRSPHSPPATALTATTSAAAPTAPAAPPTARNPTCSRKGYPSSRTSSSGTGERSTGADDTVHPTTNPAASTPT